MHRSTHKSDFVNVNGIRLHYLDWGGTGPVLLFLAGWGCSAHIFENFAPRFTDQFHVVSLTRRGHGESDYPQTGYDIDTLTEDIRQFLDCLHLDPVILVGHSLAGIELSHFAAIYPERVRGLVFLDAAYDRSSPEMKAMDEKDPMKGVQRPGPLDDEKTTIEGYVAYLIRTFPSFGPIWGDLMDKEFRYQTKISPEGNVVYRASKAINNAITDMVDGYTSENAKIQAPVLNIYSIKDNTIYVAPSYMTEAQQAQVVEFFDNYVQPWTRNCIDQFRHDVPHAKIVEIPHGHHYCFIQQEELVFNEMVKFLADC